MAAIVSKPISTAKSVEVPKPLPVPPEAGVPVGSLEEPPKGVGDATEVGRSAAGAGTRGTEAVNVGNGEVRSEGPLLWIGRGENERDDVTDAAPVPVYRNSRAGDAA
jgi:hypothetical protein